MSLILAAGYATRLYPLTLTKAKPLLEVAGKPMIDWVLDNLAPVPELETRLRCDEQQVRERFQSLGRGLPSARRRNSRLKIINDGSTDDADKLGAIGDINLVADAGKSGQGRSSRRRRRQSFQRTAGRFCAAPRKTRKRRSRRMTWATWRRSRNTAASRRTPKGVITQFEEKPPEPKSTLAGIALYYFSREIVPLFTTYIAAGNNPDQPGRFIQWLYQRKPVKTYQINGTWFDIGSKETLEEANEIFAKFAR